jgi:hypothetical protein
MNAELPGDPATLNDRAADLMMRYQLRRNPADLEEAIRHFRAALDALPASPGEPGMRSRLLGNLGAALRELYERGRNPAVLDEAEAAGRASLALDEPGDGVRLIKLGSLAAVLHTRYEAANDPRLLDEEIGLLQEAVRLARPGHPYLGGYLANLTNALHTRLSTALGEGADPEELSARLVDYAREAVTVLPADDRGRALVVLAMVLLARSEVTGAVVFLWEAADVARRGVAETAAGHVARAGVLANAAAVLRSLNERTGAREPAVEAVRYLREAARISGAGGHNRVVHLSNLAHALRDQWSHSGETALLADALSALREAARNLGPNDARQGTVLTNLVQVSLDLAARTGGDPELLELAEQAARAAVEATGEGHRERASRLMNLALVLAERGRGAEDAHAGDELLRAAVQTARQAVGTRSEPADRARIRTDLAAMLQESGERAGDLSTLRKAVETARAAEADLGPGDPLAHGCRVNLAAALRALARLSGGEERASALAESLRIHRAVAQADEAPALLRIRCHRAVAELLAASGAGPGSTGALAAIEAAVELLPRAVAPELPRADREYAAGLLAGLPARAAAVAVGAGRPERAVELAEYSRGLLVAELLDARGGQLARARRRPEAAGAVERLEVLRRRVEALEREADLHVGRIEPDRVGRGEGSRVEQETATRRQLQAEQALLVRSVRRIEGLEDFLRPPDFAAVARAAEGGLLVYVYADEERCDALLVSAEPEPSVRVVPLRGVTLEAVAERAQSVQDALALARDPDAREAAVDAAEQLLLDQLAWLWDAVAEPVLAAAGIVGGASDGPAPRIWWCPIGVLTRLPLHAAGRPAAGGDRSVLDRVVASYVPSARALLDARARPGADVEGGAGPGSGPLVVSAPDVEGFAELTGALEEAAMIERLCPDARLLRDPRCATVLKALPAHRIAHFACHGEGDLVEPGRGRLILPDHETEPLTVSEINRLTLHGAELAYLSACETTVTSLRLADEAVHLTAAFQLSGYRRVVGTLWTADDAVAYDVAERFYETITSAGTAAPDAAASAHALREALLAVRAEQRHRTPSLWAGYVHFGA